MNNTKNNHFVPQGYLKNFLNDKLSLYKYVIPSINVFNASPQNP